MFAEDTNNIQKISLPLLVLAIVMVIALSLSSSVDSLASEAAGKEHDLPNRSPSVTVSETAAVITAFPDFEMVFVKGGCFQMGDPFREGGDDERPMHEVCVDDFTIGKYEITQAQWQTVMGNNPSGFRDCDSNCPIENISLNDIQKFLEHLREMTGRRYRLPTEAEWEYAASSGGKRSRWSGTNDRNTLAEYAWFIDNAEKRTHPVGQKKPNSIGLYDMSGNVSEWVLDRYDAAYYKQSPKENPKGPSSGVHNVIRGGSIYDTARQVRITFRDEYLPSFRTSCIGFRLIRVR